MPSSTASCYDHPHSRLEPIQCRGPVKADRHPTSARYPVTRDSAARIPIWIMTRTSAEPP
jgi:hypothetical protein